MGRQCVHAGLLPPLRCRGGKPEASAPSAPASGTGRASKSLSRGCPPTRAAAEGRGARGRRGGAQHRGDQRRQVEVALAGGAHDAGQDLLGVGAVAGAVAAAHLADDDGGPELVASSEGSHKKRNTAGNGLFGRASWWPSSEGSHKKRNTAGNSVARCRRRRAAAVRRPAASRAVSRPRAVAIPCSLSAPALQRSRRSRPARRTACTSPAQGTVGMVLPTAACSVGAGGSDRFGAVTLQRYGAHPSAHEVGEHRRASLNLPGDVDELPIPTARRGGLSPAFGETDVHASAGYDRWLKANTVKRRHAYVTFRQPVTACEWRTSTRRTADAPAGLVRRDHGRIANSS